MPDLTPVDRDRLRELADEYDDSTIDGGPDMAAGAIRRLLEALDQAEAERDQARAQVDRVRAVHQPSDPDDPSACPFSCTCGWWAYDECPTVRALDGT